MTDTQQIQYRLIRSEMSGGDGSTYTVEFNDPAVQAAFADLTGCDGTSTARLVDGREMKIDRNSPFWRSVSRAVFHPRHCDERGRWVYVDGTWRPLAIEVAGRILDDEETATVVVHLLEMHQQVLARFDRAVPTPYNCAGHTDGCPRMVAVRGGYCPSCARDAD